MQVTVPSEWTDAMFPGTRRILEAVQARNARIQAGKRWADDLISDKAAEGLLADCAVPWHLLLAESAIQNTRQLIEHKISTCLWTHYMHLSDY